MPIEAVIFDMEGVLVDSEGYWEESRRAFAETLGKTWTEDDQRAAMGRNTIEWARVMQERLGIDTPLEDIMADVIARVLAHYDRRMPVLPGALEAVHTAASKYKIALASGSPTKVIRHVMQLTGLDRVFDAMVFGDDIARGKPAPDIYLEAARKLGVPPERCVGVEDSANGVRAVKAAGMVTLAVPNPDFPLPDDVLVLADVVLSSWEAFSVALIESLVSAPRLPHA